MDGAQLRIKANRIIIYHKLIIFREIKKINKKKEETNTEESFIFLKEQMFSLIFFS
jgi:hypothetical protein